MKKHVYSYSRRINLPSVDDMYVYNRLQYIPPVSVDIEYIDWFKFYNNAETVPSLRYEPEVPYLDNYGDDWFAIKSTKYPTITLYCNSAPTGNDKAKANHSGTGTKTKPFRNLNDAIIKASCIVKTLCCIRVRIAVSGIVDYNLVDDRHANGEFCWDMDFYGCPYDMTNILLDFTECKVEQPQGQMYFYMLFEGDCMISGFNCKWEGIDWGPLRLKSSGEICWFNCDLRYIDIDAKGFAYQCRIGDRVGIYSFIECDFYVEYDIYAYVIVDSDLQSINETSKLNIYCDCIKGCNIYDTKIIDIRTHYVYYALTVINTDFGDACDNLHISGRIQNGSISIDDVGLHGWIYNIDVTCKNGRVEGVIDSCTITCSDQYTEFSTYSSGYIKNSNITVDLSDSYPGNYINAQTIEKSVIITTATDNVIHRSYPVTCTNLLNSTIKHTLTETHYWDNEHGGFRSFVAATAINAINSDCTMTFNTQYGGYDSDCEYKPWMVIACCGLVADNYSNCTANTSNISTCRWVGDEPFDKPVITGCIA